MLQQACLSCCRVFACFAVLVLCAPGIATAQDDQQADQQAALGEMREQLKEAGSLTTQGKYTEAQVIAERVQRQLATLAASDERNVQLERSVEALLTRLEVIRRVLKRNGTEMDAWPSADGESTVSFSADIAPIFIAKCNNCHVQGNRGGFSLASFEALMAGANGLVVVRPNNVTGSRLVDVLETGDMPRGGGTMTAEEMTSIKTWINEGAKFDGADPAASITQLAAGDTPANAPGMPEAPELVRATGDEAVLFSRDIAPVIAEQCLNCHGANNPSGQLGLDTFTRILRGGQGGPMIVAGKPDESLLIRKLNGMADGQRMPLRRPPLADDVMAKFTAWIADGAKFDGPDAATPTATVAQLFRVSQMSFDEVSAERATAAEQMWRTAHPGIEPAKHESEHFLALGTANESRQAELTPLAESQWSKIAQNFRLRDDWPLGGRVTVFVFDRRFEYSEFGRMVERRTVPRTALASRRYNTVEAYVALLADGEVENESLPAVLTEQIAGLYLSSLGQTPDWFSGGVAREVTARLHPRDASVRGWIETAPAAKAQVRNANALLNGNLPQESAAALEHNFAVFLMQNGGGFQNLLRLLREGTEFEAAFAQAFNAAPNQAAEAWLRQ